MMPLNTEYVSMLNFSYYVITVPMHWGTPTVTNSCRCGHSRKNLINHFGVFCKAITTFNLLQPKQKHVQTVGGSWCEKALFAGKLIPAGLRLTLWSTGLRPCAVFPFLLCWELSQSYSTSGLLRSLQNVHIHSPLKRKTQLFQTSRDKFSSVMATKSFYSLLHIHILPQ